MGMKKRVINYSSSEEIKAYLDSVAKRYNMTVSGVITMIIQQYRFQEEGLQRLETINKVVEQLAMSDKLSDIQQMDILCQEDE